MNTKVILFSLRKVFCLGIIRKIGDLMRLAGACINDGVCGLIRQYTGNLTSRHLYNILLYNKGTAWLSSVRALMCGVKSSNEQNPRLSEILALVEVKSTWSISTGLHTRYT